MSRRGAYLALMAVALATALSLKLLYSGASADQLGWILAPTAYLVEVTTPASFAREAGVGFIDYDQRFAIIPACAGVNFLIVAFVSGALGFMRVDRPPAGNTIIVIGSAIAAYLATLGANTVRIAAAFYTHTRELAVPLVSADEVHRIQGTAIYVASLFALCGLARAIASRGRGDEPRAS